MYGYIRCSTFSISPILYIHTQLINSSDTQLINSSDNIHIRPSCPIHTRNNSKPLNSTEHIMLINDEPNYLLVHCSESNEKHRQHILPPSCPHLPSS